MRKILIAGTAVLSLCSFGAVFAGEDAAELFKTHGQSCHGADGGRAPGSGIAPIRGQNSADLLNMLEGYRDGTFGGQRKQVMVGVVKRLSDEQMKSLAEYAAAL